MKVEEENIIQYAIRHTKGKRIVDHESFEYDYPYYQRNTQVFEDGTKLTVYRNRKENQTFLRVLPSEASGEIQRDEVIW